MFLELEIRAKLESRGRAYGWERRQQEKGKARFHLFPVGGATRFQALPWYLIRAIRVIRAKQNLCVPPEVQLPMAGG